MSLKENPKPMKKFEFWIGRFVVNFNFAKKTLVWSKQDHNGSQQTDFYFSIQGLHRLPKINIKEKKFKRVSGFAIIIGPLRLIVGLAEIPINQEEQP